MLCILTTSFLFLFFVCRKENSFFFFWERECGVKCYRQGMILCPVSIYSWGGQSRDCYQIYIRLKGLDYTVPFSFRGPELQLLAHETKRNEAFFILSFGFSGPAAHKSGRKRWSSLEEIAFHHPVLGNSLWVSSFNIFWFHCKKLHGENSGFLNREQVFMKFVTQNPTSHRAQPLTTVAACCDRKEIESPSPAHVLFNGNDSLVFSIIFTIQSPNLARHLNNVCAGGHARREKTTMVDGVASESPKILVLPGE